MRSRIMSCIRIRAPIENVLGKLFSAAHQEARFSLAISVKERLNDSTEALTPSTSKCILSDH